LLKVKQVEDRYLDQLQNLNGELDKKNNQNRDLIKDLDFYKNMNLNEEVVKLKKIKEEQEIVIEELKEEAYNFNNLLQNDLNKFAEEKRELERQIEKLKNQLRDDNGFKAFSTADQKNDLDISKHIETINNVIEKMISEQEKQDTQKVLITNSETFK
jgi:hypothetical protein